MRSFLRVCIKAGLNKTTGLYYWKMLFTLILRNPRGLDPAINLSAMFLHFQTQRKYVISAMNLAMKDSEKAMEEAGNFGNFEPNNKQAQN
jgi:hypothetical protein